MSTALYTTPVDPTLVAFFVCGPLQFLVSHLCVFGPKVFSDPIRCVFKACYRPCVQMFRPCPGKFIFAFRGINLDTFSPCAAKHLLWQRVFRGASEFNVRNLIQWTGHFAIYVRWSLGAWTRLENYGTLEFTNLPSIIHSLIFSVDAFSGWFTNMLDLEIFFRFHGSPFSGTSRSRESLLHEADK